MKEAKRYPTKIGQLWKLFGNQRRNRPDCLVNWRWERPDPVRVCGPIPGRHGQRGREKIVDTVSPTGDGGNHRHSQLARKPLRVHSDAAPACLVDQVQADDNPVGDLQYLEDEVQVAFQPGGVDDHHGDVRLAEEDEVASHLLVGASGLE